ncbi:macrophage-expressed gene 1 protein-like [Mercenaria mercenaria]|uniref:macrophage-expressed gene 1 protein-like n=1 Tax=Mercenaria mercenaria TaxID=6596 RepID=UPI00234ED13F|nr:macrophage-expressed gene 1 protein-like [Mercenaria mercenaria]
MQLQHQIGKMDLFLHILFTIQCLAFKQSLGLDDSPDSDNRAVLPNGHPNRCLKTLKDTNADVQRLETLPGMGWDNLRNMQMDMVFRHEYTQCKTSEDGMFLIPDGVTALPTKFSRVVTNMNEYENWNNFTSIDSHSINSEIGLFGHLSQIGGKFSSEYETTKKVQYQQKTALYRNQLRLSRYKSNIDRGSKLSASFDSRIRRIAVHIMSNRTRLANYESQLLVRRYGSHVLSTVEIGGAFVQTDQLKTEFNSINYKRKQSIIASAGFKFLNFFGFNISAEYSRKSMTSEDDFDEYTSYRMSSEIVTLGGKITKANEELLGTWLDSLENNLVAIDRFGEPLFFYVREEYFPDIPEFVIYQVRHQVQQAVNSYYKYNAYMGCMKPSAPNFSFQANLADKTCQSPKVRYGFGGVYQTCTSYSSGLTDLCPEFNQFNPLTGGYSCPDNYKPVLIKEGGKRTQRYVAEQYTCSGWFSSDTCTRYRIEYSAASYAAYWCAAKESEGSVKGFLFGGLFTSSLVNLFTQTNNCPPHFYPLKILEDLSICVSSDIELASVNALPFAGLFSCVSGNPFMKASHPTNTDEYPRGCPEGYSQHLAYVYEGCEIDFCIEAGSLSTKTLPRIKRPPYIPKPLDLQNGTGNGTIIFNSDGSVWKMILDGYSNTTRNTAGANVKALSNNTSLINGTIDAFDKDEADLQNKEDSSLPGGTAAMIAITVILLALFVAFLLYRYRKGRSLWSHGPGTYKESGFRQFEN